MTAVGLGLVLQQSQAQLRARRPVGVHHCQLQHAAVTTAAHCGIAAGFILPATPQTVLLGGTPCTVLDLDLLQHHSILHLVLSPAGSGQGVFVSCQRA